MLILVHRNAASLYGAIEEHLSCCGSAPFQGDELSTAPGLTPTRTSLYGVPLTATLQQGVRLEYIKPPDPEDRGPSRQPLPTKAFICGICSVLSGHRSAGSLLPQSILEGVGSYAQYVWSGKKLGLAGM